jgi:hypothetical protein
MLQPLTDTMSDNLDTCLGKNAKRILDSNHNIDSHDYFLSYTFRYILR